MSAVFTDAPIEIETDPQPRASVIWLHGLGADGNDFVPVVRELDLPNGLGIRFIFPHAPMRPVTVNGGYVMRAWYDIAPAPLGYWQDRTQIDESATYLDGLVSREVERGIDSTCIVLAGFSQGGTVALQTGLACHRKLAGLLILSAPVLHAADLVAARCPANAATAIFLAHGTADNVVPFPIGERTQALLKDGGWPVSWHRYEGMPHSVNAEEIMEISRWLREVFRHCAGATLLSA